MSAITRWTQHATRNKTEWLFVLLVCALGSFLRFYRIGDKTLWLDEAFSVWVARHSLWESWRWLIRIDQHPPLYYNLLHFWIRLFGDLPGAVRGLSALASTLSLPIFYGAARRFLDRTSAAVALLILAVSPFHVRFAQETRMYGLLTLEVALVLFFLARLLTSQQPRQRDWIGLAVAQALAMLTHNTATVYLPVALNAGMGGIFLLSRLNSGGETAEMRAEDQPLPTAHFSQTRTGQWWRSWLTFQGLAFLLWLPWAVPFVIQTVVVDRQFWLWPPWPGLVLDTFRNFHFAFLPNDLPLRSVWMWAYPVLALLGVIGLGATGLKGTGSARRSRLALMLVTLFLLPHIIGLLVSLRRPIYYDRTLIWTTLPYLLLVAAGLRTLADPRSLYAALRQRILRQWILRQWILRQWILRQWILRQELDGDTRPQTEHPAIQETRQDHVDTTDLPGNALHALAISTVSKGVLAVLLAIILVLSSFSLNGYYFWFEKEGWDQAAAYVAEQVQPDDLIIFNATWVQIPFEYYYRHFDRGTELRGLPADLFERGELEPRMTEADVPYLHQLIDGRERVWLVYSHDWYTDPEQIIPRELETVLPETERVKFEGLQVIHFRRSSEP